MIIHNLDVVRVTPAPLETHTPLFIDANAVLPGTVAAQLFQAVGRRDAQIVERDSVIQHPQFAQCDLLNIGWQLAAALQPEYPGGFVVAEGFDHSLIL